MDWAFSEGRLARSGEKKKELSRDVLVKRTKSPEIVVIANNRSTVLPV